MGKQDRVFQKIEKNIDVMISMQKELTAVPAIAPESGGQGEWNKAQVLLSWLARMGITEMEVYPAPDNRVPSGKRPNLVATIPGESDDCRLWIMSHLDIVPPGDLSLWISDPYKLVRKDGVITGRGVEDNQQGIVSSIIAAASILELGFKPRNTVKLLFIADEETGSDYGIQYLLANHQLFSQNDFVLVPDGGWKDGRMIQIAEKSILWLKFQTEGKQCHAASPGNGINAFVAASQLVLKLNELNQLYLERNSLFDPPVSTFSPTKKEANIPNINTIPADDVFYLDSRILPSIDLNKVMANINTMCAEVEKKYGVKLSVSTVQRVSSPPTPADSPMVTALKKALKTVYSIEGEVRGVGGGTVASFLRNAGIHTLVWSKLDERAHMPNEYCLIENMIGDAKVMAYLMLNQ